MPGRIILRPDVPDDLREIAAYFEQQGHISSKNFAEAFFSTLDELALMPGLGSQKFFRSPRLREIRSWPVRGLRKILIFYRPMDEGIEVFAVLHGARNIKPLLSRRLGNP